MPRFIIQHITKYTYPEAVRDSANQVMLYPLKDGHQEVQSQRIVITGEPFVAIFKDYYENEIGSFMNIAPHTELRIDSTVSVLTKPRIFPTDDHPTDDQWNHLQEIKFLLPFIDFLKQENFKDLPEVKKVADEGFYKTVSVYTAVQQLNEYVYNHFNYIKGITTVETTLDEIWKMKAGVCQDFAHILLVMLRLLCIPARYVSGYVCPHDNDLRGQGATHAWVEAYIPFYGWLGLDPTNNCLVNDLHVRLAIGRNFNDCSPVKGTYKGTAKQSLEVGVSVSHEDGSVAKEMAAILTPQAVNASLINDEADGNSYRRYMQMVQQQQ
ncbi:MAG: transglutaminase family protein [Gloeobacteraceae cyanobacterium ES-bin-316]|nr:transglutaminase family protein [Ferruginibacter sp.]